MSISEKERNRLRDLAKRQVELANSDTMRQLYADWEKHGRFDSDSRPLVTVELRTFAPDVLPPLMQCESEEARGLEWMLLANTANHLLVQHKGWFRPFDLEVQKQLSSDAGLGHHFVSQIVDLENDFGKLKKSAFGVDTAAAGKEIEYLQDIFGDSIAIRLSGKSFVACLTQDIVHVMDMQDMFMAMYDYPVLFKQMIGNLAEDYAGGFPSLRNRALSCHPPEACI